MKTIKLPYRTNKDLTPILKQYSSVVRYSYNRFLEKKTEKDIRGLTKSLNNIDLLNSWLIQCGIRDAKAIQRRFNNQKIVFGGKFNLVSRAKNRIPKDEYQAKRLTPISIQGEMLQQGNRCFKLDIIENNQIIFKVNKSNHIKLGLPKLRNNIKHELFKLQRLNEVKQKQRGYTYSIRLDLNYIYISFEEFKSESKVNLLENRYLGIDLNPNTIGISVLENGNVIHTQEFSLKPIFNKVLNEKLTSDSGRMKYYQNKLKFETFEISKSITKLAKDFNCKSVFIEELHFKKGDSGLGKGFNRKTKNLWKRELFINNLSKRLSIEGIKLFSVNPAYSSFIGNIQYDYTDAINASIEIARRGFEYRINKVKNKFYPDFLVKHRWKEMATKHTNWKEFYLELKNLKLKYRVSLDEVKRQFKVFEQNSTKKSMVLHYIFYG